MVYMRVYVPLPFKIYEKFKIIEINRLFYHGSHFFGLTNFPDFSSTFCSFPVFFKVLFYLKYSTIFAVFSLFLADKFL